VTGADRLRPLFRETKKGAALLAEVIGRTYHPCGRAAPGVPVPSALTKAANQDHRVSACSLLWEVTRTPWDE
jgi:hypothetical protein